MRQLEDATSGSALSRYVSRVMNRKGLTCRDVARRSRNADQPGISASYLSDILSGRSSNVSVKKMEALARGLGVEPHHVFEAARDAFEPSSSQHRDLESFLGMMRSVAGNPRLLRLIEAAIDLTPNETSLVLKAIEFLNANRDSASKEVHHEASFGV